MLLQLNLLIQAETKVQVLQKQLQKQIHQQ